MKAGWLIGLAVVVVGVAILAGAGVVGLASGTDQFPAGGGFFVTPAGEKLHYGYDARSACISASDDGGRALESCGADVEGTVGGSNVRISIHADDDVNSSACVRSRLFRLDDEHYGFWCILS